MGQSSLSGKPFARKMGELVNVRTRLQKAQQSSSTQQKVRRNKANIAESREVPEASPGP